MANAAESQVSHGCNHTVPIVYLDGNSEARNGRAVTERASRNQSSSSGGSGSESRPGHGILPRIGCRGLAQTKPSLPTMMSAERVCLLLGQPATSLQDNCRPNVFFPSFSLSLKHDSTIHAPGSHTLTDSLERYYKHYSQLLRLSSRQQQALCHCLSRQHHFRPIASAKSQSARHHPRWLGPCRQRGNLPEARRHVKSRLLHAVFLHLRHTRLPQRRSWRREQQGQRLARPSTLCLPP